MTIAPRGCAVRHATRQVSACRVFTPSLNELIVVIMKLCLFVLRTFVNYYLLRQLGASVTLTYGSFWLPKRLQRLAPDILKLAVNRVMFLIKWLENENSYLSFITDANSNKPLISQGFKKWSFQKLWNKYYFYK